MGRLNYSAVSTAWFYHGLGSDCHIQRKIEGLKAGQVLSKDLVCFECLGLVDCLF